MLKCLVEVIDIYTEINISINDLYNGNKDIKICDKLIHIERGMYDGMKILISDNFNGRKLIGIIKVCDFGEFNDIVNRYDILLKKKIHVYDILTGTNIYIKHFDKTIRIQIKNGDIHEMNNVKILRNKGMPKDKDGLEFGNMIIDFQFMFPKERCLNDDQIETLKDIFMNRCEDIDAEDVTYEDFKRNNREEKAECIQQ